MSTEHTPTPWTLSQCSGGGLLMVRKGGMQSHVQIVPKADADFIVRAVNAHDAMVEATTKALLHMNNVWSDTASREECIVDLRAALALATKGATP